MDTVEKDVQIALGTYLASVWRERCGLCGKGDKLIEEGRMRVDAGCNLVGKGWDLIAEGKKLITKGRNLIDNGNKLFSNAVEEIYGKDIKIQWLGYNSCKLSNGIEMKYDPQ